MQNFTYTGLPARVLFGTGTTSLLPAEVERLACRKALVLTTEAQAALGRYLCDLLGPISAGLFPGAAMHTPVEVTDAAVIQYRDSGADCVVSIGGGSTIGLGKAIALRTDAPQIVLPTSYAGSEMTPIIGQTDGGKKTTQTTLKVLPETVIYDVTHTLTLPPLMTVTSGMNALAHAVEALYAEEANPVLSLMAEDGIAKLTEALERVRDTPQDTGARSDALYGAWLCAVCLGSGGVALHHKLCHVLGGSFDLPHAETHTVMLPHALAYNAPAVPDVMEALRRATGSQTPAAAFFDISSAAGAPTALRDLGMPEDGIERAVEIALDKPYYNPRDVDAEGLRSVFRAAWQGARPDA
ncbi:Maleylacetate reductase [Roseivivax jejudonensis]|uniref:Maleylacetate reductase n=1 Tax=Roseivivax jejudonensis TaxID=1529041 RepID=A0A1X7A5L6_9RHOB|nr:maleylacetate reductase [Roseivivax jejudonensis]SLN71152.1 Maleylacetate reductase [Roseivivax jejudonensis]